MGKHISTILLLILPIISHAQLFDLNGNPLTKPLPSILYHYTLLTPQDTLYVDLEAYSYKIVYHKIKEGQTLYSIAKFYGMDVDALKYFNGYTPRQIISKNKLLQIPITNRTLIRYKDSTFVEELHIPVCYRVGKGETLYRIAKRYFQIPVDILKKRNKLESNFLYKGQKLHIGWISASGISDTLRRYVGMSATIWKKNQLYRKHFIKASYKKRTVNQKGMGYWQRSNQRSKSASLFALHATAPINSIIRVYNPMTRRGLFVKVLARIPKAAYPEEVIVVVSPAVAKTLGIIDPRFYAKVTYLK